MLAFIALLIVAMLAASAWCTIDVLRSRARASPRGGVAVNASAIVLGTLFGAAALLRFVLVPPHHAMYVDEPWYAEAACNLIRSGQPVLCEEKWSGVECVPYEKAWGWPMLLAPWIWLFGCETSMSIEINRVLGSISVLLVAIATRCAGGQWWQGMLAAAILAFHPVHVGWSATGETNVSAAAAFLVGLCGALLYIRTGRLSGAVLASSALGLATSIRPESFLPGVASGAVIGLTARAPRSERVLVGGAVGLICGAALASGLSMWSMNQSISGGAFLSPANVVRNLLVLAQPGPLLIHGLTLLVAFCGAVALARSGEHRVVWLLVCAASASALTVLAYDRFAERMLLSSTVALLPLSGFSLAPLPSTVLHGWSTAPLRFIAAATLVLMVSWASVLLSVFVPPQALLETRIASHVGSTAFAADSLFIAEQPTVLAASGMVHVMGTEHALRDPASLERTISAGRPVYFLCDMFCEPDFREAAGSSPCRQFVERFEVSPVLEEKLDHRTYALYRVSGSASGPAATLECPKPGWLNRSEQSLHSAVRN